MYYVTISVDHQAFSLSEQLWCWVSNRAAVSQMLAGAAAVSSEGLTGPGGYATKMAY